MEYLWFLKTHILFTIKIMDFRLIICQIMTRFNDHNKRDNHNDDDDDYGDDDSDNITVTHLE